MRWKRGISIIMLILVGCSDVMPEVSDLKITLTDKEGSSSNESDDAELENIMAIIRDSYDEAVNTNTLGKIDIIQRMVVGLGENGYVAVDSNNQIDMTRAEQVLAFCDAVEKKESAELTIIVITELGFRKFELETQKGVVNIVRGYYQYDENGYLQNRSTVCYQADLWQYTEEGYLIFEGNYFSDENFVLTLSDTLEHTALRVLPLDEKCRELNRKYILPIGYEQNNIFLCNWSGNNYKDLDFYDIFDRFYAIRYNQRNPYIADENLGIGLVYQIPEEIFENVVKEFFYVDAKMLRAKTRYLPECAAYEYRPRGFYEIDYSDIPYPEVVSYTQNQDGTITLDINAVDPNDNTSKKFSHRTVVRPLKEGRFQYVSNEIILAGDDCDIWWHSNRLTDEEWNAIYGGNQ